MLDNAAMKVRLERAFREVPKLSNVAIADACNVTPQAVGGWRRTGRVDKKHFAALAKLTGKPLAYWLGDPSHGEYPYAVRDEALLLRDNVATYEPDSEYVRFEVMGVGGAGPGMINSEYPEVLREVEIAHWQLQEALGRTPSPLRVKLLTVRGDSMAPKIRNGDVVFVDTGDTTYNGDGNYAVVMHDHTLVKRLELRLDGLHLVSLATPDRPDIVTPDRMDTLHIAGRILGAIQLRKSDDL